MITEQTLFILGAGASKPYGFPTAYELRENIIKYFRERKIKDETLGRQFNQDIDRQVTDFLTHFNLSNNISIDLFLSRNPQFSSLGKEAIITNIIDSESRNKLHKGIKFEENWYLSIFTFMMEGLSKQDSYKAFAMNKITFLTFNYDRSLEHYLYLSFRHSFPTISQSEIDKIMNQIKIIHIYGKTGRLPWQNEYNTGELILDYGHGIDFYRLQAMIKNIKTIEEREPIIEETPVYNEFMRARKVFFLGFSFADENMDVLQIAINSIPGNTPIYCTSKNLTNKKTINITNKYFSFNPTFPNIFKRTLIFENIDSNELLKKYLL